MRKKKWDKSPRKINKFPEKIFFCFPRMKRKKVSPFILEYRNRLLFFFLKEEDRDPPTIIRESEKRHGTKKKVEIFLCFLLYIFLVF
jgi:hypothetical protein